MLSLPRRAEGPNLLDNPLGQLNIWHNKIYQTSNSPTAILDYCLAGRLEFRSQIS